MKAKEFYKFGNGRIYCDMPDWVSPYEDEFESDCSRLIYAPSFRRLQGKTQLFPNGEYDFFRNRLTHSLEVNEIAQCIGTKLNKIFKNEYHVHGIVLPNVIRLACLAHDLGHPPFGHDGEKALDELMGESGFDGNAQTFRILTRIEKGCINYVGPGGPSFGRSGLNLTYRSLASILKHIEDKKTDKNRKSCKKGYYESEQDIVNKIYNVLDENGNDPRCTVECQIMDMADDISNAVHDLEDSLKGNLLNPFDLFFPQEDIMQKVIKDIFTDNNTNDDEAKKIIYSQLNKLFEETGFIDKFENPSRKDIVSSISPFYKELRSLSVDGVKRTIFINNLINKFIDDVIISNYDADNPIFTKIGFKNENDPHGDNSKLQINILKKFHMHYQCKSSNIESRAYRGQHIVENIFNAIILKPELMPDDFFYWYNSLEDTEMKKRCICDFISGMTDRYCIEFFGRLFSESPQSIFKPI